MCVCECFLDSISLLCIQYILHYGLAMIIGHEFVQSGNETALMSDCG